MAYLLTTSRAILSAVLFCLGATALADSDPIDAALSHVGRSPQDLARDAVDMPTVLLRLAGIRPGMQVADLLGFDGYYSELSSYVVGEEGKVLLINNEAYDHWSDDARRARLRGNRLPNVKHVTRELSHLALPKGSLDAVLLIKVYHELYWIDPQGNWPKIRATRVIEQLFDALKDGGTLLLVDHSAKTGTGSSAASTLHRIDEAYATAEFERCGFHVIATSDALRNVKDERTSPSVSGPMVGRTDRFVVVFRKSV